MARHYGVTNGSEKLIHYYHLDEWEMFDLKTDPNELVSVYGKPDYAGKQKELKAELDRLREKYEVPEDPRPEPKAPKKKKGKKK